MVKVQYKYVLTAIVPMSMYLFAPLARILFVEKKNQTLSSGFWDSLHCKPQEDHTLAEDYCGRWIQVDLACGNLPSIDDSQFSCSVPLLAQVTLTQLVTKSAVGTTILMLLKCCNC